MTVSRNTNILLLYPWLLLMLLTALMARAEVPVMAPSVSADAGSNQETLVVRLYQTQARYSGGLALLDLALGKLNRPYRIIRPDTQVMNEARGERLVIQGQLDLQFMSTTPERERAMIPIRIPVYQGILGLRLLLAKKANAQALSRIRSTEDLARFTGGHGSDWGDLPVYAANQLPVITNPNYEGLFRQLIAARFDYFHRGLNEIWDEHARYQDQLVIVDDVMLFYPLPTYFFVSPFRPELAVLLETGLRRAYADGSAQDLFQSLYGERIAQANLRSRHLIILKNPDLPERTPPIDTSWWLPE